MSHRKNSPGFTIVELLVVIIVIGILAAITIVSYTGITRKATIASLQSDLTNGATKLNMYYTEYGVYPDSPLSGNNCPSGLVNPTDLKYCLKSSSGNALSYSSSTPYSTFSLTATNTSSATTYKITNNTAPVAYNSVTCTGGNITTDGLYTVQKFTNVGTNSLSCSGSINDAEVLIVAGGGGGRSNPGGAGSGGGGAGGLIASTVNISGTMPVIVGNGGGGDVGNGGNSSFANLTAIGGGMGGYISAGNAGGSGGGGSWNNVGGAGTNGQGYNGAVGQTSGGGGGGTSESGGLPGVPGGYPNEYYPGKGGAGINSDIVQDGVNVGYAGGGGGGARYGTSSTATHGGGYSLGDNNATSGTANTGGGGGGAQLGFAPGSGGSGIVVVRYLTQ